jgi:nicotinamide-nucleotide amidase
MSSAVRTCFPNPLGSAVGMMLRDGGKFLVVLPGPPRENKPMFEDHVFDSLKAVAGDVRAVRRILRVSGMGESAVDELIAPNLHDLSIGTNVDPFQSSRDRGAPGSDRGRYTRRGKGTR